MDPSQEARRTIEDLSQSVWAFATLTTALEAGLLEQLAEPQELGDISAQSGLDPSLVEGMLDVLVALRFAHRDGQLFVSLPPPGCSRCWRQKPRRSCWPSCAASTCRAAS